MAPEPRKSSYRFGLAANTAGELAGRAAAALAGIMLAKVLGAALFGKYFSDQALVLVGAGFYNMGLGQGYRQITSREPATREGLLTTAVLFRMATIALYGLALVWYLAAHDRLGIDTALVIGATLLLSLVELFQIDVTVRGRYVAAALFAFGKGGVPLLAMLWCLALGGHYRWFVRGYAVLVVLLAVGGALALRPHFHWPYRGQVRRLLWTSLPFALSIAAFGVTNNWGVSHVRTSLGDQQAGLLFVPLKVYQVMLIVGASISSVTLPLFHVLAHRAAFEVYRLVYGRLVRGMLALAGVVVGACVLAPDWLIRVLATSEFSGARALFPILGVGLTLRLLSIPAENVLESLGRQGWRVGIQAMGAVGCVGLVAFLVSRNGLIGAAWAALAIDIWLCSAFWIAAWRCLPQVAVPGSQLAHLLALASLIALAALPPDGSGFFSMVAFLAAWVGYSWFFLGLRHEWRGLLSPREC